MNAGAATVAASEDLHRQYHSTRDPSVRSALVSVHLEFARRLARRYCQKGEPQADLEQAASIGLLKAIDRFDPDRGIPFAHYATGVITGELKRHFRDRTWAMHVPRAVQELHLEAKVAAEALRAQLKRSPTIAELATHLDVREEELIAAVAAGSAYRPSSLDAALNGRPRPPQVGAPDEGIARVERRRLLESLFAHLCQDDQQILRLYYFHELTQADIGRRVGLTQVEVSRRLAKIMERLQAFARTATA